MAKEFIPVNELLERTTLQQFIDHYDFDTEVRRKGNEERIRNPFACEKCSGNNQAVSVNWKAAVFTSHCYHCSVKGRIATLLFGMKYGRQPSGGKLKGDEFKDIAVDVAQVAGARRPNAESPPLTETPVKASAQLESDLEKEKPVGRKTNLPLHRNPDERIARLVHLSDELIRDPAAMSGRAQSYLANREYMNEEMMEKWDVGYLPANSRSSLRSRFVYTLRNERSEKIGYVGRDLAFDDKLRKWEDSDRTKQRPVKAKFPPGFARGEFLYGAEASRLKSEQARHQLQQTGLVVVEGMNDVIALAAHGILSVSVCSNRIAAGQLDKLVRWSHAFAGGKLILLFDNDKEGYEGAIDSLQRLAPHSYVSLAWTPDSAAGEFRNRQPEQLGFDSLLRLIGLTEAR